MSSKNKIRRLRDQMKKCEGDKLELLQEKQKEGWPEISKILEQKKTAEDDLRRQKVSNSIETYKSEKELEDLKQKIKCVEDYESELKVMLDRTQVNFAEYEKLKNSELRKIERQIDEIEKIMPDESGVNELHKRREELKEKLRNLDVFCVAMYSTLEPKESKKHILK